jgi:hypothetical protein
MLVSIFLIDVLSLGIYLFGKYKINHFLNAQNIIIEPFENDEKRII